MRIALYGPYMFELAVGLRENPDNEVRLFLDEATIPRSLFSEPVLADADFVEIGESSRDWVLRHHDRSVVARHCERMLAESGLA